MIRAWRDSQAKKLMAKWKAGDYKSGLTYDIAYGLQYGYWALTNGPRWPNGKPVGFSL